MVACVLACWVDGTAVEAGVAVSSVAFGIPTLLTPHRPPPPLQRKDAWELQSEVKRQFLSAGALGRHEASLDLPHNHVVRSVLKAKSVRGKHNTGKDKHGKPLGNKVVPFEVRGCQLCGARCTRGVAAVWRRRVRA